MGSFQSFGTVFVGAGASGIGPVLHAIGDDYRERFWGGGIALIDAGRVLGCGSFGNYQIRTNSRGSLFLECFKSRSLSWLSAVEKSPVFAELESNPHAPAAMVRVAELLERMGLEASNRLSRSKSNEIFLQSWVRGVSARSDGVYDVNFLRDGVPTTVTAQRIVFATGAKAKEIGPIRSEIQVKYASAGAREPLTMHSDEFLTRAGFERAQRVLKERRDKKVLIVGGGDSAFSSAWLLLQRQMSLPDGAVVLAHRRRPKVTFESRTHALSAGYTDFEESDICPKSGIVHRIGGLRFDSADLYLAVRNGHERRLHLAPMTGGDLDDVAIDWSDIALVVFAIGYTPRWVPLLDVADRKIPLQGERTGKYVDATSRVMGADGSAISNLFAVGMCSGFLPMEGGYGGEPSFTGLANSIALCHGQMGASLVKNLTAHNF